MTGSPPAGDQIFLALGSIVRIAASSLAMNTLSSFSPTTMFPSLLITGPFSIVLGFDGGLMALNDRLKLRSMVVGEKDDKVFIASEEAAIRTMEPNAENIWSPAGGEPVIVKVKEGAY